MWKNSLVSVEYENRRTQKKICFFFSASRCTRVTRTPTTGRAIGYLSTDWVFIEKHVTNVHAVADLFNTADDDFFHRVKTNSDHVLQPYLPDPTNIPYQLRNRSHNITLINKTKFLNDTDFIIRILYKYSYWQTIYNPSICILISALFIKHSHADCISLPIVF